MPIVEDPEPVVMPSFLRSQPAFVPSAEHLMLGLAGEDAARLEERLCAEHGVVVRMLAAAWLMGATAMRNAMAGRRICRICGCWEHEACEPGCSWVAEDLCSVCAEHD